MSWQGKLRHLAKVCGDRRWWPFYLQRRVLQPQRRDALTARFARWRPQWSGQAALPGVDADVEALHTSGLALLRQVLNPTHCEQLRQYFLACLVEDPYRQEHGRFLPDSKERPAASHVAYHLDADVLRAPGLLALANSPRVLDTVARFLGCKPTIAYMAAWWSYPTGIGAQQAEHFHRDVDDWRFVKLFVYLSDVGPNNGPHVYVTHSSRSSHLRRIARLPDAEVEQAFGRQNMRVMTGSAGDAFMEDTFGIHKGQPVVEGRRLIFQVVYSMFELPYGPRHPVALWGVVGTTSMPIDLWINRIYLAGAASEGDQTSVSA